jgi:hypothetical protein
MRTSCTGPKKLRGQTIHQLLKTRKYLVLDQKTDAAMAAARLVDRVPEVVGHVLLAEGGVGGECQVDLPRRRVGGEVAATVQSRRPHGELVHVVSSATKQHGRRRRPGKARSARANKIKMQSLG